MMYRSSDFEGMMPQRPMVGASTGMPMRPTGPTYPAQPVMGGNFGAQPGASVAPRQPVRPYPGLMGSFKKGGKVRKTGPYLLHKGEKVVSLKAMRRAKSDNDGDE